MGGKKNKEVSNFDMQGWEKGMDATLRIEDFVTQPCFVSIDRPSFFHLCSVEFMYPQYDGTFVRFGKYYLPKASLKIAGCEYYRDWHKDGLLTVIDGDVLDFELIKADILHIVKRSTHAEIAYDPYDSCSIALDLQSKGVEMVGYQPIVRNMSCPTKRLDELIQAGNIRHNGDKVASFGLLNTAIYVDAAGNRCLRKKHKSSDFPCFRNMVCCIGLATIDSLGNRVFLRKPFPKNIQKILAEYESDCECEE